MILLIHGPSHTGKTTLAQQLLERYRMPYLSIDHLKMGLIRSGQTSLTPLDDDLLTEYLWPILREIIKTAVENGQNLIVEGCYIPYDWKRSFAAEYAAQIHSICLVFSRKYIERNFAQIARYANAVEQRLDDSSLSQQDLILQNETALRECTAAGCPYWLIEETYRLPSVLEEIISETYATKI